MSLSKYEKMAIRASLICLSGHLLINTVRLSGLLTAFFGVLILSSTFMVFYSLHNLDRTKSRSISLISVGVTVMGWAFSFFVFYTTFA